MAARKYSYPQRQTRKYGRPFMYPSDGIFFPIKITTFHNCGNNEDEQFSDGW